MKRIHKIILIIATLTFVVPGLFIVFVYCGLFGHLQSKEELYNYKNATASVVLSEEGELIGKIFSENRTNISYGQIPSCLKNALIAAEDARFFEHKGIDSRSLLRVLVKSVLFNNPRTGGGSTISQQLAKNMFGRKDYGKLTIIINKTKEALLANRLERLLTKEEILTLYLNTVSFGEDVYGIEAASARYFNKKPEHLKTEEAAVLIGVLKANTFYNPRINPGNAATRRNLILKQMEKYNYLEKADADSLCGIPLKLDYSNIESEGPADYFLYQVKKETKEILQNLNSVSEKKWSAGEDGLKIVTTLNLPLQNYAVSAFHDHLAMMQEKLISQYKNVPGEKTLKEITERELKRQNLSEHANDIKLRTIFTWNGSHADSISVRDSLRHALTILHAGLLAMDPYSGYVKAWVGGINFQTLPYDQILAKRQLASIFKPILYALAFEEGMEPCQYLDNDSVSLTGFENWSPENYDHSYGGKYSLAGALAHSMNIPSFSLFMKTDFTKLDSLWKQMGFSSSLDNTPSLPLGTAEASIKEVAVAYSSLANGGYKITPVLIKSISTTDGEIIFQNEITEPDNRVITKKTSQLLSAILQKAVREGTGASVKSVYGVSVPLAGKTGTSQNYADAWFAAFNPGIVIVSRAGSSLPVIHFNSGASGSGSALALPLVALTLKKAESDPAIKSLVHTEFPVLPTELEQALNCPDFKEKNLFDRFLDIFEKDKTVFDNKGNEKQRVRKSLIKRLLGI